MAVVWWCIGPADLMTIVCAGGHRPPLHGHDCGPSKLHIAHDALFELSCGKCINVVRTHRKRVNTNAKGKPIYVVQTNEWRKWFSLSKKKIREKNDDDDDNGTKHKLRDNCPCTALAVTLCEHTQQCNVWLTTLHLFRSFAASGASSLDSRYSIAFLQNYPVISNVKRPKKKKQM